MKRKTADRLLYAAIAAGITLLCVYSTVILGVVILISAIGIMVIMRDKLAREVYSEEAAEEAERMAEQRYQDMVAHTHYHIEYKRYVMLGKGYK